MRNTVGHAAVLLAVALTGSAWVKPKAALTPGATFPTLTTEVLCKPGYTAKVRQVSAATKHAVLQSYGKDWGPGPYEIDHFYPLELSGSNDQKNLWPQPLNEAREKDKAETALHRAVCKGTLTIKEAQAKILADWGSPVKHEK